MPSINTELGERALSKMQHEMDWKPLKERCLRAYPTWSTRHVDRILREYHRFLALKVATRDVYDTIVLAPVLLDAMWQQHILATQQYTADCQLLLQSNQLLHYNVDAPVNVSASVREKRKELTKASLCMMFAGTAHFDKDAKGIWDYEHQQQGQNDANSAMDSALSSVGEDGDDDDDDGHLVDDTNEEDEEERPPSLPPLPAPPRTKSPRKTRNVYKKPTSSSNKQQQQQYQSHRLESSPENRRLFLYVYMAGKVTKLLAYPHETILKVKTRIQRKTGIPPQQQFLEWDGLELDEPKTIDHYRIPNDATLVLTKLRNIPHPSSSHNTESLLSSSAKLPDESQTDTHRDDHDDGDLLDIEARDDPDRRLNNRRGQNSSSMPLHSSLAFINPSKPPRHPHQQQHPHHIPYNPSDDSYGMTDPRRRQVALLNKIKLQNHSSSSLENESTLPSRPRSKPTSPMHNVNVFVNTIMGFTINIIAKASDSVERLKQMIEEQEDIPFSKQILILDGVPLVDSQLLTDYTSTESLYVLLRLQAGTASVTMSSIGSPSSIMAAAATATTRKKNQNKLLASRGGV